MSQFATIWDELTARSVPEQRLTIEPTPSAADADMETRATPRGTDGAAWM